MRTRFVLFGVILAWAVGCSKTNKVDHQQCEALRDHLVEVRLASAGSADGIDLAQHRRAMKVALGESFITGCERTMSVDELHCAMRATHLSDTRACTHASDHSN